MNRLYLILFLLLSCDLQAEEVEEIIISRVYSATDKSPVTYQDVDKSVLQTVQLQEPSFMLQKTPSIVSYSDSGSYQGYSYFRLRGIDQTRINMTLDGIPLNEPEDQGVYFSNYPGIFASVEKMQIQRGVGTSQNGTASYAGSIQLHSVDINQPQKMILDAGYASFDSVSTSAQIYSGIHDSKSIYLNVNGVSSDGYKEHSGNQSQSVFVSGMSEDESGRWRLLGFSGKQYNELAWVGVDLDSIQQNRRTNANASDENDRYQQSLISIAREQHLNDDLQLEVRGYYNYLNGSYDFDYNNFIGQTSTDELYNYKLDSDFYGIYSNLHYKADSFDISSGIHFNQYQRKHVGSEKTLGQLYQNTGYRDSYAAFIKYQYYIDDLILFADLQYRYADFDYKGGVEFSRLDWSFTNPRLGLSYRLTDTSLFYYSFGKTGREPTRTDLFGGADNLENNESGEANLFIIDPESVIDHELGLRYNNSYLQIEANIFYINFDKEITLSGSFGPNGLLLNQDVDRSIRKGLELSAEVNLNSALRWKTFASYTQAEIKNQGEAFHPVMTPEWIAYTSLEYYQADFSLGFDIRYQDQAYINLANTEKIPDFTVCSAYAAYQWKSLEWKFSINNLFDKSYLTSGVINASGQPSYFVSAPINYSLGVRVIFE